MISVPLYLGTIAIVVAAAVFFVYFFSRIQKENREKAKIIHVPEAYEKLWVEIDKKHTLLRSYANRNQHSSKELIAAMEEYEAVVTKYKHKLYGDFQHDN